MIRTATTLVCLSLILALANGLARPAPFPALAPQDQESDQTAQPEEELSQKEDVSGPIGVFADIEEGWRKGDVDRILRHFGKGRVSIAIEGGPLGGSFSRDQSFYLLTDYFKYTITKKYEFVQYRNVDNGARKAYAIAERYYKKSDDGRLFKDKIYVSLQVEDGRWVVSEIKSTR